MPPRRRGAEPGFRFYLLYHKIHRADILRHAYDLVRANKGAPGVDGVTCAAIEACGLENWLTGLETELRTKTYQPQAVRRVMIPKPGGLRTAGRAPVTPDASWRTADSRAMKPVGKPGAGKPHDRFDERGLGNGAMPDGPSYRAHPRRYRLP
jgi:RNA-directed DNA polymerase